MKCVEIYRDHNEFYLKLSTDRWWIVRRDGMQEWGIQPFAKCYCPKSCISPTSPISQDAESPNPPFKTWSKCSRLDYLTITTRSLDKDVEIINRTVEEAWRRALGVCFIEIKHATEGISVRACFDRPVDERNQQYKANALPMIDSNPDRVSFEWRY